MKKIIYIIPILLLSIVLVNNVYGATNYASFNTTSEFYDYLNNENPVTFTRTFDKSVHDIVKSSDLFISTSSNYNYYVIFGGKVVFFNNIPKVAYYHKQNTSVGGVDILYLSLYFDIANVKYAYFNFDITTGALSTGLSTYNVGSGKYDLVNTIDLGYLDEFYDLETFYNQFDSNFELLYYSNNEKVIPDPVTEFSFIPSYSENYETCNLKLNIKNPPDYYTLEYAINSSNSTWYQFNNSVGVTVSDNCLVIVRMLDENGDEIFASSINVTLLDNQLSTTYFKVEFDNPGVGHLNFTPIIYYNFQDTFDLYLSINSSKEVYFTNNSSDWYMYNDNDIITNLDYFKITPANTYRLISQSTILDFDITLNFKLVNKTTGITGLERSFTFNMGAIKQTQAISSSTNSVEDKLFHTGGTNIDNLDENINNPFSNINNNSSFEDIASVAEESFTTFSALFSILPGFIWAIVAGAIGILIVLRVLGR